ncbi:Ankyrin repeat-containing protein P1E11.10 [Leucoagaricus sp. SymC.cos]|nr:Ankyrin repeat-containing protein P1E11.10 [Leucoagaricus sp. SymC.cos]
MAIQSAKNIWVAAGDGDLARVTELVESRGLSANIPDQYTYTPMHAAASYGHLPVLEYLIARGGDVNVTDDEGDTPLYTVENIETARFLIEHGAVLERTNNEGISPIEHLREDFPEVAAYLETLLPGSGSGPVSDGGPASPSQHSQNQASERLTDGLMARIADLGAEPDGEALRRVVTESVLASLARGQEMQQEEMESHGRRRF